MQHQQDPQLSATRLGKLRPINLSTSSGWVASSKKSATSCWLTYNLKTASKSLSALLYILRPYPCWTCLHNFRRLLVQPSHLPSTKAQVTQPLLEGYCNKTSASDLKWVASSFPTPAQKFAFNSVYLVYFLSWASWMLSFHSTVSSPKITYCWEADHMTMSGLIFVIAIPTGKVQPPLRSAVISQSCNN